MTISAKILADSINTHGQRMTTMEIEYPRFILAELNTHRMLSKNSASSRAIPVTKMHEQLKQDPALPVFWGRNQAGMQAETELTGLERSTAELLWELAMEKAIEYSQRMNELGLHKQITNRVTEPWMCMRSVISGTEWTNFFHLRNHKDAQPEIKRLAEVMLEALQGSEPELLKAGEWHVPYVHTEQEGTTGTRVYIDSSGYTMTAKEAQMVSASCCAQVSYRKNDASLEKAQMIFDRLINGDIAHSSPLEHQATPMAPINPQHTSIFSENGITHVDKNQRRWSGNLCGWIQFRKTIPNEAQW